MTNSDLQNDSGQRSKNLLQDIPEDKRKAVLDEVSSWLGRLVLLYGVPFHYLIPDGEMLPGNAGQAKGSLRFFFLDPVWIQCLVQGACSIGNNGYGDSIIDKAMNQWVQPIRPAGKDHEGLANQKAASIRDRLRLEHEGVVLPGEDTCLDWPLNGFLLRSPVVGGWRGLEVMAYKFNKTYRDLPEEEKKRLLDDLYKNTDNLKTQTAFREKYLELMKPLRIEQLSKDVMLGIFNGIIAELVIRQPQEGLHFGVTRAAGSLSCTKTLRELGYKHPGETGELLVDKNNQLLVLPVSLREEGEKSRYPGVVNIAATAAAMKEMLLNEGALQENRFTSAEFAVEMIEAAGEFTYRLNIKSSSSSTKA